VIHLNKNWANCIENIDLTSLDLYVVKRGNFFQNGLVALRVDITYLDKNTVADDQNREGIRNLFFSKHYG